VGLLCGVAEDAFNQDLVADRELYLMGGYEPGDYHLAKLFIVLHLRTVLHQHCGSGRI
jgi:hypothetical protein